MYSAYLKRGLDMIIAGGLLILFIPFFLLAALLIKLDSRGPVLFIHSRVGKDLSLFSLYKFRTMTDEKRAVEKIVGRANGVTRVGYYFRRFKIDELPQLINVIKGDMSLVGPRPSVEQQLADMSKEEKKRYSVRPGMTGLAQVCGNVQISWANRFKYDLRYVENISFLNDMRILLRTILIVIKGEEAFINRPLKLKKVV